MLYDPDGRRLRRAIGFLPAWIAVEDGPKHDGDPADAVADRTVDPVAAPDADDDERCRTFGRFGRSVVPAPRSFTRNFTVPVASLRSNVAYGRHSRRRGNGPVVTT